jgi:hypothetical protein
MLRRLQQIEYTISDRTQRYNAYVTTLASAMIIPNYTQTGWGITRIPSLTHCPFLPEHPSVD